MLYYLSQYLGEHYNLVGAGLFEFLSFRAGISIILSLLISLVFGEKLINFLQKQQVKETVRKLGLEGEEAKQGTPTMGGVVILGSVLLPVILFSDLSNIYIMLMLFVTLSLGAVGFIDDYIKVFLKDKGGLRARSKLIGQFGVGFNTWFSFIFSS